MTTTDVKKAELALSHCGNILVEENNISGWCHPIPLSQWREWIGFHKTMSIDTNSETVSYHRWNPKIERYDTIIPHQITNRNSLFVHTPWDDPRNQKLLDRYYKQWSIEFFPANTIHTHVKASAFESGTDARDEEDLPGWHITLGHLDKLKRRMDIHSRFRLPKLKSVKALTSVSKGYDLPLKHLFEKGTDLEAIACTKPTNHHFLRYKNRVCFR